MLNLSYYEKLKGFGSYVLTNRKKLLKNMVLEKTNMSSHLYALGSGCGLILDYGIITYIMKISYHTVNTVYEPGDFLSRFLSSLWWFFLTATLVFSFSISFVYLCFYFSLKLRKSSFINEIESIPDLGSFCIFVENFQRNFNEYSLKTLLFKKDYLKKDRIKIFTSGLVDLSEAELNELLELLTTEEAIKLKDSLKQFGLSQNKLFSVSSLEDIVVGLESSESVRIKQQDTLDALAKLKNPIFSNEDNKDDTDSVKGSLLNLIGEEIKKDTDYSSKLKLKKLF